MDSLEILIAGDRPCAFHSEGALDTARLLGKNPGGRLPAFFDPFGRKKRPEHDPCCCCAGKNRALDIKSIHGIFLLGFEKSAKFFRYREVEI